MTLVLTLLPTDSGHGSINNNDLHCIAEQRQVLLQSFEDFFHLIFTLTG